MNFFIKEADLKRDANNFTNKKLFLRVIYLYLYKLCIEFEFSWKSSLANSDFLGVGLDGRWYIGYQSIICTVDKNIIFFIYRRIQTDS